MKLVGASFAGVQVDTSDFDNIIMEAVRQLNGEGLSKSEAEAQRESLIQGYRWILVDEYQDVGPEEYALISAVAGRSLEDTDLKLSLFAVGDDDQNIYSFNGASIEYIRRFEEDYKARPAFLIENYRATANIIEAANQVISNAPDRMKVDHTIKINSQRLASPLGGRLEKADPVAQGRVQILDVPPGEIPQAVAAVDDLIRLSRLDPDWNWARAAVISRDWKGLGAVRSYAEKKGLTVEMANEDLPNIWRLRETQKLISGLRLKQGDMLGIQDILTVLNAQPRNKWVDLLAEGIAELARELKAKTMPVPDIIEWLAEWSRDTRGEQRGLLLLTAHRAKGLEFDHVVILNGGWDRASRNEDNEAPRRLFYVAMTRARQSLTVLAFGEHPLLKTGLNSVLHRRVDPDLGENKPMRNIYQMPSLDIADLSFAGRQRDSHEVHTAVCSATVGDSISIEFREPHWVLVDERKRVLGRMAKAWRPPEGYVLSSGNVGAIINWRKADNGEEYIHFLKRENWETVLPELVFQPMGTNVTRDPLTIEITNVSPDDVENDVPDKTGSETDNAFVEGVALSPRAEDSPELDDLKTIMQDAVSQTKTWDELAGILKESKIKLSPKGGGLTVRSTETDEDYCKLSEIRFSYINLIRHYGEGFPEHTATWLVERALNDDYVPKGPKSSKNAKRTGKRSGGDGDFDLIED